MSGLDKALKEILDRGGEQHFSEIYDRLPEKQKKDLNLSSLGQALEAYLMEAGNTVLAVNRSEKKVVTRESLFADCSFRIQLTAQEIQERELVIGHRLLPFIHPEVPVEQLHFFDENDQILPITRTPISIDPYNGIFFNLLPPYGLTQYIQDDGTNQILNMATIDLQDWLSKQAFNLEDQILVSVKDYTKFEFYLEKIDSREVSSLRLADRYYDKQLSEAINHVFDIINKSFLPVDMHLFWAFAQLEPALIEKAGTPFGPFISQHEVLTFFQEGPYAFLQNKNFMEELMENAIQYAKESSSELMGNATDLNGIFQELGNSSTQLLLEALMVEQLLEWDEIQEEKLIAQIFSYESTPFYNEQQEKHFYAAFTKSLNGVKKSWENRQLALPHLQLLRKATQFKMEIVNLLRELNYITNPDQLNVQALLQLQPIDQSLDQILENILSKTPMPHQEAQSLVKQLDTGREKFLLFRDELLQ